VTPITNDDDRLLDELRHVFHAADPMPAAVRDAARRAFEQRLASPGWTRPASPGSDAQG
jgi:hypothetical protein